MIDRCLLLLPQSQQPFIHSDREKAVAHTTTVIGQSTRLRQAVASILIIYPISYSRSTPILVVHTMAIHHYVFYHHNFMRRR